MSSDYDDIDPQQRLRHIESYFGEVDNSTLGLSRAQFCENRLVRLAVVRLLENIYQAAHWFVKTKTGPIWSGAIQRLTLAYSAGRETFFGIDMDVSTIQPYGAISKNQKTLLI